MAGARWSRVILFFKHPFTFFFRMAGAGLLRVILNRRPFSFTLTRFSFFLSLFFIYFSGWRGLDCCT